MRRYVKIRRGPYFTVVPLFAIPLTIFSPLSLHDRIFCLDPARRTRLTSSVIISSITAKMNNIVPLYRRGAVQRIKCLQPDRPWLRLLDNWHLSQSFFLSANRTKNRLRISYYITSDEKYRSFSAVNLKNCSFLHFYFFFFFLFPSIYCDSESSIPRETIIARNYLSREASRSRLCKTLK